MQRRTIKRHAQTHWVRYDPTTFYSGRVRPYLYRYVPMKRGPYFSDVFHVVKEMSSTGYWYLAPYKNSKTAFVRHFTSDFIATLLELFPYNIDVRRRETLDIWLNISVLSTSNCVFHMGRCHCSIKLYFYSLLWKALWSILS